MPLDREGRKEPWWSKYIIRCPNCDSKNIERLDTYKGFFKDKSRNLQKMRCKICGEIFWE